MKPTEGREGEVGKAARLNKTKTFFITRYDHKWQQNEPQQQTCRSGK
jgi:hypothetical protein